MKFYPLWSSGWGEMATDGRTDGRTDDAATICLPIGKHNYPYLTILGGPAG